MLMQRGGAVAVRALSGVSAAADELGLAQGRLVFALIKAIAPDRVVRADADGA
jgi:molybdopterin-binding protein